MILWITRCFTKLCIVFHNSNERVYNKFKIRFEDMCHLHSTRRECIIQESSLTGRGKNRLLQPLEASNMRVAFTARMAP